MWWAYGTTFTEEHHPPPQQVLGDAGAVMVFRCARDTTVVPLLRVYGRALERDFELAGESRWWLLYRRKAAILDENAGAERPH